MWCPTPRSWPSSARRTTSDPSGRPLFKLVGAFALMLPLGCAAAVSAGSPEAQRIRVAQGTQSLADWGIDGPQDLRFGLLSWDEAADPHRFAAYRLSPDTVPRWSGPRVSRAPEGAGPFVIAEFDAGNRNALDGFFNAFARPPSSATVTLGGAPDLGGGLSIAFNRRQDGFAGAWVHLFDLAASRPDRRYLDARGFRALTLWVRGEAGSEPIDIKVADADLEAREDAARVGRLGDYLTQSAIGAEWRQAVIPLTDLPPQIELSELASVVFEVAEPAQGRIWIRKLALLHESDAAPGMPAPVATASSGKRPHLATWLWNTSTLMRSDRRLREAVDFVDRAGFDEVFLQLPGLPGETGRPVDKNWNDGRLQQVVAAFTKRGIRVSALDGFRSYALPSMHDQVLDVVDRVVRYNTHAAPEERFSGLHHDVEPYLLSGFHGPRKEGILRGYLALIKESARRVHTVGMDYGMDIPFWYDALDEHFQVPVSVEFEGVRKPASHHVIDLVDEVTIMDYRTSSYGADGTIRHASGELEYASAVGTPVLVGLETTELPDETLLEFHGAPSQGLPDVVTAPGVVAAYPDGDSIQVTVVRLEGAGESRAAAARLTSAVSGAFGGPAEGVVWWPIVREVPVPADKLTFWKLGADPLREVARATVRELSSFPAFAGLAVHYVGSLERLRACPERCPVIEPEELRLLEDVGR